MNEYGQGDGTLTRAAGLVTDARAELHGISARMTDQVAGLRGAWGGQGATAFFGLHRAWTEQQAVLVDALDDLARSLDATERTNVSTDDEQGAGFGRLAGRLG